METARLIDNLLRFRSYSRFESVQKMGLRLERRRSSPRTLERYLNGVAHFLRYLSESYGEDLNPDSAIEFLGEREDLESLIDGFIDYLMGKLNLASSTVMGHVYGVKKWLTVNGVKLDWDEVEMISAETEEMLRSPTLEELRRIYRNAELRERVIEAICVSSGIRIGGGNLGKHLLALQLKDVDLDQEIPMIKVPPYKAKGRRGYITFMSPEAKKLLDEYLDVRRSQGEEITGESPLITTIVKTELGKPVSYNTIVKRWKRTLRKAGLHKHKSTKMLLNGEETKGTRQILTIHSLRKYFKTTCIMNGVPDNLVERWMGHKGKYLDLSYFHPSVQKMLEKYRMVIPHLTISKEEELERTLDARITEEVGKVREDLKRKDEEIMRLRSELKTRDEEERREMEKIKADLEALKRAYYNNH